MTAVLSLNAGPYFRATAGVRLNIETSPVSFKVGKEDFSSMYCSSLASSNDEVEAHILSDLFVSTTTPKFSDAILVHCTDVRVPLEKLCGEMKIELGIMHYGKRFLKNTLILFEYQL